MSTRKNKIKVGFCVAYDWDLLRYSLPLVYNESDKICLALDKDRISWSGNPFHFEEDKFYSFLKNIDPHNKIILIEEDFHISSLSPMENEVRQRNRIAEILEIGGWHVQLDADEYFIDFKKFTDWLQQLNIKRPTTIMCPAINLWKQVHGGYLYVEDQDILKADLFSLASNNPKYVYGRREEWFSIVFPSYFIHQSWARTEKEIISKIKNWGHSNDFDTQKYVQKWLKADQANYQTYKNIHPIIPNSWKSLNFLKGNSIDELIQNFHPNNLPQINSFKLLLRNSIWISRLKSIFK